MSKGALKVKRRSGHNFTSSAKFGLKSLQIKKKVTLGRSFAVFIIGIFIGRSVFRSLSCLP